jgi:hypothetical protein
MNRMDRGPLARGSSESVCATRPKFFAQRVTIFTLTSLTLSGLVAPLAMAQVAQAPISSEALATNLRAKREAVKHTPSLEPRLVADSSTSSTFNSAQGFGALARDQGHPGCDLFPAPANIGTNVDLSYFGPPPSTVNQSLVGPVQLLDTGQLDSINGTITIPLYKGSVKSTGKTAWYILTDVSDPGIAAELGLNFSAKMNNITTAARTGNLGADGNIIFDKGTVNFAPERNIVPGPEGAEFPPKSFAPGEVGDADYSPFVRIANGGGVVYNASMIAYDEDASQINFPNGHVDYTKVHDAVQAIDPYGMTVTLALVNGFSFGRPVWYISMDASIPLAAAIERIFIATNGTEDCDNPQRQGLSADLNDGHRPNNTLGGIPTLALDYSPAWDANLYTWTDEAISKGYRQQLREEFQILTYAQDGLITGASATKPFGSAGFSINCPIVQRLD